MQAPPPPQAELPASMRADAAAGDVLQEYAQLAYAQLAGRPGAKKQKPLSVFVSLMGDEELPLLLQQAPPGVCLLLHAHAQELACIRSEHNGFT